MALGFGPEGLSSIPDDVKDPPSACVFCARKVRGRSLPVYNGCCLCKQFPSLSHTYQNCEKGRWMMLPFIFVRQKSDFCYCKNRLPTSGVTYLLCIKHFIGLGSQVAHVNNNNICIYLVEKHLIEIYMYLS